MAEEQKEQATIIPDPQPTASPRLGQRRGILTASAPAPDKSRNINIRGGYRERLEQLKMEIIQLSNRNTENMLRNLRSWLADK